MRDPGKQAERLITIRLRYCVNTHLNEQEIPAPADIARTVGLYRPKRCGC
jgi:hypothetical protein